MMKTEMLINALRQDVRLQFRNGFYYAGCFVAIVLVIVANWVGSENLYEWLPIILFGNSQFSTFYFMAGLVLLEREEGTIYAQAVTPMSAHNYLLSKCLSLSVLITLENLVITFACDGTISLMLIFALMMLSMLYCLLGFICVLPFRSINTFLLPSMLVTGAAVLPVFHYREIWTSAAYYLHPLTAHIYGLDLAFNQGSYGRLAYVVVAMILAYLLFHWLALKVYFKFVYRTAP